MRKFVFNYNSQSNFDTDLEVKIPEVISASYGMYTWPCAPVLAQYVWHHASDWSGLKVLEIGAGTALPGIVAAKCGAQVILSDSGQLEECLRNCRMCCQVNGLPELSVVGISWGLFTPELVNLGPVDVILGSDCFYDPAVFEDILVTVSFLLQRNPGSSFVCAYQQRASDWSLDHLLRKWNLDLTHIPLSTFGADSPNIAGSSLPGSHAIQLFKITSV